MDDIKQGYYVISMFISCYDRRLILNSKLKRPFIHFQNNSDNAG